MTSTDDFQETVQAACEAAARGDAATVMKSLESRPVDAPTGLDEPLLPMSPSAKYLLQHLDNGQFHPEYALRALMSIPPCFETPWRAALCMIQAFHSQSGNLGKQSGKVLWTCVTDVQTFLQLAVEAWWKQQRQRTSSTRKQQTTHNFTTTNVVPRQLLEQLADTILEPLNSDDVMESCRDNQHWTQPLELVTTIVALCQDLEEMNAVGTTLSDHILNRLFPSSQRAIRPSRLLTWLTVVSDLRSHLRSNDWTRLHDILYESITQNTESIPPSDMPGLVRGIVSLLVKQSDENHSWEILILHLLYSASQHATTYSTVETVLKSSLASLPNPVLKRCIHAIKDGCDALPKWISSNMNLLLLQAIQESGSQLVSSLVSRALGKQGDGVSTDWQRQCWESLKHLAFPSITDISSDDQRRRQCDKSMVATIKSTLEGAEYLGIGEFSTNGKESCVLSSKLVYQSIFLGQPKPSKRSHHIFASERAQLWIHAANTILRPSLDGGDADVTATTLDALFAILITVTVYCEVPISRSTIVRTIVQCLSGTTIYMVSKNLPTFHCAVVALIVRSISRHSKSSDDTRELYPLADTFGGSLSKDVFIDLTAALSLLLPARSALLSISRKYLQSSFGGNLWWNGVGPASKGMHENRDRLDSALHGLCTLIATESQQSWDEYGVDSWIVLSEIIVQNKPALPMHQRSDLFRRLGLFAKQGRFSYETVEHLQRACLVRLLQFFREETRQCLEFVPEHVFVSWGLNNATNTAGSSTSQREDISGLLCLVMVLLGNNGRACNAEAKAFSQGRERILWLLSNGVSPNDAFEWTETPFTLPEESTFLHSSIAFCCVESILRLAMPGTASTKVTGLLRNDGTGIIERWQKHLVSIEIDKCKACGRNFDHEKRLSWLNIAFLETADTRSHQVIPCDPRIKSQLLCGLCDVVMDLIFHPDFSDDSDTLDEEADRLQQKRRILNCTTTLICLKIDLSEDQNVGIRVKDTEFQEVTFASTTLRLSAVPLLDLYAFFVKDALSRKTSLDAAEDMFVSLLTYCSALNQLVSDEDEEASVNDLTGSRSAEIANQLWSLYCDVGDEESAQRLVTYLEEQALSQLECQSTKITSRHSLLTINVDDDVDRIVRHVRLTVISTMSVWFESLVRRSSIESSKLLCADVSTTLAPHADGGIGSASYWVQCLHRLSLDLKAGLDGLSGGMTEALYSTYLSLIESACKLASPMDSREIDEYLASHISCTALKCAMILKNIICSFPLRSAAQFKKTMILSASDLPALRRKVILLLVASGRGFSPSSSSDWAIDVFYQMMRVTKEKHGLDKKKGTPWAEIVGPEHSAAPEDDDPIDKDNCMSDCDKSAIGSSAYESSLIPSIISIPGNSVNQTNSNDDTINKENEKKVQLPSKESLVWASCSSLAAMEQVWSESLLILSGNTAVHGMHTSPRTASSWKSYSLERTKLLSNLLKAVCFAMRTLEELEDAREATSSKDTNTKPIILAATFSEAVKIRFCVLLEKVSTVLQVALRSISNHLKKGDDVCDLVRAESLSCLTSWLAVKLDDKSIEFLTSRWYHAEKKLSRGESNAAGSLQRQSPALKRLPKFLVRCQELESDLSKLYQMLLKSTQEGSSFQQQVVHQYESLLSTASNDGNATVSLQSLIKTKLKTLSKDRASTELFGLIGDEGGTPRKRSRKVPSLERQMRRERRRNVKRSRNRIVDNWLHLDDEYEMDEGADDDAFVDLEDFLVDG